MGDTLVGRVKRTPASGNLSRLLLMHSVVTGALFIPEVYYAGYMQAHFTTQGGAPVYFVPDNDAHRVVLGVTVMVDAFAVAYLGFFLRFWLYGKTQRPVA